MHALADASFGRLTLWHKGVRQYPISDSPSCAPLPRSYIGLKRLRPEVDSPEASEFDVVVDALMLAAAVSCVMGWDMLSLSLLLSFLLCLALTASSDT